MSDIDFGKQVGPLPLGAWVAVIAGGLGIALWSRQRGGEVEEPQEDIGGTPGVGEGGSGSWIDIGKPPTDNTSPVGYATNEAWGQAAINWLIAQGYAPGLASSAITKALAGGEDYSGNKMSVQEWSLWTLALREFGSPPQPVNVRPPSNVPGPVTPPSNPPPMKPPPAKPLPRPQVPPKPLPTPVPGPKPLPTPVPGPKPLPTPQTARRYETWRISPTNRTLSALVAASNRKHGTNYSWQTVWNYNLQWRSPAIVAILKIRGPHKVVLGSAFQIPY